MYCYSAVWEGSGISDIIHTLSGLLYVGYFCDILYCRLGESRERSFCVWNSAAMPLFVARQWKVPQSWWPVRGEMEQAPGLQHKTVKLFTLQMCFLCCMITLCMWFCASHVQHSVMYLYIDVQNHSQFLGYELASYGKPALCVLESTPQSEEM